MSDLSRFEKPQQVSLAEAVFGGNMTDLMPPYEDIPEDFKHASNPWVAWQMKWFFKGLDKFPDPKDDIDISDALGHLRAIQGSFEPKHEEKEAAVAYLASRWLINPT